MRNAVDTVGLVNLALFSLVALVAIREWRVRRSRAGLWAAATFASLAVVVDVGRLLPDEPRNDFQFVLGRCILALLVLFPYFLYRFTTAFRPPTVRLERWLGLMTLVLVAVSLGLPDLPQDDEARPAWFLAYLTAFLVHWTVLSVVVGVRLWRAGRGQPSVARRRMRMLTLAAALITVALFVAAAGAEDDSPLSLLSGLLATLSALTFLLGLAPPAFLRMLWRRAEQERLQTALAALIGATDQEQVTRAVLPPMASIVGARGVALTGHDGRVLGSYAVSAEQLATVTGGSRQPDGVQSLEVPSGHLYVWTTPYAPYFGSEELELLRTLGALTGLALDRARLFAGERESRLALERTDELKTNFIALAAHELRTPVTTIYGLSETIRHRGDQLSPETIAQLQTTLGQQTRRMADLVEQLLDLSRLDAEAVAIRPERVRVDSRVAEVVAVAAGDRADEVEVEVEVGLEAEVDPHALDRILSNLVVNALRYGSAPIRVTASHADGTLHVAVEDRGPGVPPDFVPHLFDRFMRSETTTWSGGGSGLGLAIARSYARAHRGDLSYVAASPHGARFELELPVGPRPADGPDGQPAGSRLALT